MKKTKFQRKNEASLTVEASLVLPVFLFGTLFFLYFFQLLFLQDSVQSSITEAGKYISRYQRITDGGENSDLTKQLILQQCFMRYLDKGTIHADCILGGILGISFLSSEILEEGDVIDVVAVYQVRFPVPFFGEKISIIRQRVKTRAFVGMPMKKVQGETAGIQDGGNGDFLVYITENGTVYHMSEGCTHLRLSVVRIEKGQLETARNENGGKYKPCEKCVGKDAAEGSVYVARDGDRYHNSLSCPGLKRTIYAVHYFEVQGKRRCSRCG